MVDFDYVSFSRLDTYSKCSQFYSNKYVLKTESKEEPNISFLLGDLVHKCLEYILLNNSYPNLALMHVVPEWLYEHNLNLDIDAVQLVGLNVGKVLHRCSPNYNNADKIRNKDGSCLKDPLDSPSKSFKDALNDLDTQVHRSKFVINSSASAQQPEYWIPNNFGDFISTVYGIVLGFNKPTWWLENYGIEYKLSSDESNLVYLDKEKTIVFKGFVDWIVKAENGQIVIGDHKTSKKLITPEDVMFHPQLNLYAFALHQLTGLYPTALFIHHARSNTYVVSEFEIEIMADTVNYYLQTYKLIKNDSFIRKHPNDFNSPCLSRDWKTGSVSKKCQYIDNCWPIYNSILPTSH